jgi:cytochrome bd-type quinol oxidase subunit 2
MKIIQHLSVIAIITIVMGLIYASVQQTYRSNADDPQAQIAYDMRDELQKGKSLVFDDTIELDKSLAVFKETYDENGNPIQSTGFLNGKIPQLPKGVFELAKTNGENWVTYQPQRNVRMAVGIVHVNAAPIAYLVVGRSLQEVEERVSRLTKMVFIGWILCVAVVLINWLMTYYNYRKKSA